MSSCTKKEDDEVNYQGSSSQVTPTKKAAGSEGPSTPKRQKIDFDFWKKISSPTACNNTEIQISDLSARYYPNRTLTLRVSYFNSFQSKAKKNIFKFQGQDETGRIQCVCFDDSFNKIGSLITKLNEVISINDFRVVTENSNYPSGLGTGLEIVLLAGTEVKKVEGKGKLPELKFDFVQLDKLDDYDLLTKIDVIGIVVQEVEVGENSKGPKHTIAITDRSKKMVQVGIWKATEDLQNLADFPVVILQKVTVQEYGGRRTLSCWSDGCSWVRPDIPEAREMEEWFNVERQKREETTEDAE